MAPEDLFKIIKRINKIENFNPIQKEALRRGLLKGKNLLVSAPTSSGKTLIGEIAALNCFFNFKKKMIYLSPLVALAREKYNGFREKYGKLGVKIALSIGDYDSLDPFLERCHWIIGSNEKIDSLIRHKAPWINKVGLVIIDEIHLLQDPSRGPTLEILITLLKKLIPKSQFLALSATVGNPEELSAWLGAEILKSNWRPVKLYQGIFYQNQITFFQEKENYSLSSDLSPEEAILENTLFLKKQIIFFLSTRKNAEALAKKLSRFAISFLEFPQRRELEKLAQKIKKVLEAPTSQCKKLAECVRGGVAFYHSGLLPRQRVLIEENFKKGVLKAIVSTTALAYGMNLPAFRAVVRDTKRFSLKMGITYLPVLEVQQMFGRAGRPQYDKWGEGILIAKNEKDFAQLAEIYFSDSLEKIESKIFSESALRTHILALLSTNFCQTIDDLINFFSHTFFGYRCSSLNFLEEEILNILETLEKWNFIEKKRRLKATILGKRISQLYLDPLTAHFYLEGLKAPFSFEDFPLLCLLAKALELKASFFLKSKDFPKIEEAFLRYQKEISVLPSTDDDEFLKEIKLALIFQKWIEEVPEKEILEGFDLPPGELKQRLKIGDWLLYSLIELGKVISLSKEKIEIIKEMRERMRYGVKKELLYLVKIKGIGRQRARILFNANLINPQKIKEVSLFKLSKLLKSKKLAEKIKSQLG